MPDRITLDVDEARAIIDGWLTKAYPRSWQREYVANGIVGDLKDAPDERWQPLPQPIRSSPMVGETRSDPLHDTEQAMSRGWR